MVTVSVEAGIVNVLDIDSRIAARQRTSEKVLDSLICASAKVRKKHCISGIILSHELWTVWDGDELPVYESSTMPVVRIWPYEELARRFGFQHLKDPSSVPIPIDEWLDRILFKREGALGVIWCPVGKEKRAVVSNRDEFRQEIEVEWRRAYGQQQLDDGQLVKSIRKGIDGSLASKPKDKLPK